MSASLTWGTYPSLTRMGFLQVPSGLCVPGIIWVTKWHEYDDGLQNFHILRDGEVDGKMSKWRTAWHIPWIRYPGQYTDWLLPYSWLRIFMFVSQVWNTPIHQYIYIETNKQIYLCATEWITEDQCKNHSMSKEYYNNVLLIPQSPSPVSSPVCKLS